ncbi:hypothetical protein niasHT_032207 [Heterodera trifolii]|uniref:Uncharacterized protein n=1 Tax=Heterodera trifolii TaxID=157864 RepID=A0ABD2HRZ4_9BILA
MLFKTFKIEKIVTKSNTYDENDAIGDSLPRAAIPTELDVAAGGIGKRISDIDRQIEVLMRCECLTEQEVKVLCSKAREIFLPQEGKVQRVDAPVTICGYPWPIPRPKRTLSSGWSRAGHKFPFPWRLCGPRLQLRGDISVAVGTQNSLPGQAIGKWRAFQKYDFTTNASESMGQQLSASPRLSMAPFSVFTAVFPPYIETIDQINQNNRQKAGGPSRRCTVVDMLCLI